MKNIFPIAEKIFSDHKIPKKIYFIDEIPKTPRGKLNRELP